MFPPRASRTIDAPAKNSRPLLQIRLTQLGCYPGERRLSCPRTRASRGAGTRTMRSSHAATLDPRFREDDTPRPYRSRARIEAFQALAMTFPADLSPRPRGVTAGRAAVRAWASIFSCQTTHFRPWACNRHYRFVFCSLSSLWFEGPCLSLKLLRRVFVRDVPAGRCSPKPTVCLTPVKRASRRRPFHPLAESDRWPTGETPEKRAYNGCGDGRSLS
jgi:hypothetical protein